MDSVTEVPRSPALASGFTTNKDQQRPVRRSEGQRSKAPAYASSRQFKRVYASEPFLSAYALFCTRATFLGADRPPHRN